MLGLTSDMRFRLYVPPCDMRKGFNGLEALVANDMQEQPTSGAVYVFLNRKGDRAPEGGHQLRAVGDAD